MACASTDGTRDATSAVPVVQNLPDLHKYFDENFKSIGDLMKAANVKISRLRGSSFVICDTRLPAGSTWRILK